MSVKIVFETSNHILFWYETLYFALLTVPQMILLLVYEMVF